MIGVKELEIAKPRQIKNPRNKAIKRTSALEVGLENDQYDELRRRERTWKAWRGCSHPNSQDPVLRGDQHLIATD